MAFGRLERGKGAEPMSEINVTPLVDVMLVLLVIFIITAPLFTSAIKVDLPKTDGASQSEPPRFVALVIDKAGQIYLDDQPISEPELVPALRTTAQANPEAEVRLRADQSVPYARVFEVMNDAQKAGLNRIGFVAEASGAAPSVPAPAPKPAPGS